MNMAFFIREKRLDQIIDDARLVVSVGLVLVSGVYIAENFQDYHGKKISRIFLD